MPTPTSKELVDDVKKSARTAVLDTSKLRDETLSVLVRDSAVPEPIRVAAEKETRDRLDKVDQPAEPIDASFGGGQSSLVKAAEKRAKEFDKQLAAR